MTDITRRGFLKVGGASVAAVAAFGDFESLAAGRRALRMGVVGLGSHGRRHAALCGRTPGVDLKAICDIDRERLRPAVGESLPAGVLRWTDVDRVIYDQNIDAVVLAVPAASQAAIAVRACQSGKHVLLEQPCILPDRAADLLRRDALRNRTVVSYFRPDDEGDEAFARVSGSRPPAGPLYIDSDGTLPVDMRDHASARWELAASHEIDALRRRFALQRPSSIQSWAIPRRASRQLGGVHILVEWPRSVTLHLTVQFVLRNSQPDYSSSYVPFRRTVRGVLGAASMTAAHCTPGFDGSEESGAARYPEAWWTFVHRIRLGAADTSGMEDAIVSGGILSLAQRAHAERTRIVLDPGASRSHMSEGAEA